MAQLYEAKSPRFQDLEKHCQKLEYKIIILQSEKDYFEKQLQEKEKSITNIQNQLHSLKRRIHHHKATWSQIAHDNKMLKEELSRNRCGAVSDIDSTKHLLSSLLEKIWKGKNKTPQKAFLINLVTKYKFYECLKELLMVFQGYLDETSEKSFSYTVSPKGQTNYSIEHAFSPIFHETYSDEDEEIEKLMDESKVLMKTLEKQNNKLDSLHYKMSRER
ncbi:hypothetical protein SteCoe_29928 [Stentor coeruleus]|uniref:Uncharacterized protein n=1 Tax=Stentor coeruleus TaxID=5963 RepID=A0A1R2B4S3_9CILI|nr:hypothetical protein SteCoe_29928 [Stentor coeruleus]